MNDWKAPLQKALDAAQALEIRFNSVMDCTRHLNGPVTLVGAVIERNEDYDDEALPYFFVKAADGEVFQAGEDELQVIHEADQPTLNNLIQVVAMPFAHARDAGWLSPGHLMDEGSDEQKASFLASL
jgi:hypothetical protein